MDIILENINKSYGEKEVLKDFNLILKEGSITFIMGKSGVGKTSLLKIILGLDKSFYGKISGTENKNISVVFQENRLCEELNIRTNIKIINDKIEDKQIKEGLKSLGIKVNLNTKIKELSGGMKRRVAILRAILISYDLLILDEPFKGLDEENKKKTMEVIKENTKDKITIIVTHDKSERDFFENSECLILQ